MSGQEKKFSNTDELADWLEDWGVDGEEAVEAANVE